ncbi:eukaryotic translation initiation factor 4E type 1B [Rhynochetos jubatus]
MATGEQRRQEERRRRRAQQQELLLAESLGKHPLQNRWALWFFKNDKSKMWQANLRLVTKFSTVEDFWALYSHIQLASKLTSGCDYSLFKDGIEPMWEDSQNKRGGRWLITLAKQQRHTELDRFWLETLLCLIGEMFDEYSDEVCGAVINIRAKGDKIAIWTREAENREGVTHIGRIYKEHLGLSQKVAIGYQAHADTATKSGSLPKTKFVLGIQVLWGTLDSPQEDGLCHPLPKAQAQLVALQEWEWVPEPSSFGLAQPGELVPFPPKPLHTGGTACRDWVLQEDRVSAEACPAAALRAGRMTVAPWALGCLRCSPVGFAGAC